MNNYNKNIRSISRIENFSSEMIDRTVNDKLEPLIFSNSMNDWSAIGLWKPNFFKEKYGSVKVETHHNLPNDLSPYLYEEKPYHRKMMKFSDFIDLMPKSESCYVAQSDINILKDIDKDYNFFDLIPTNVFHEKVNINLWIGSNTRSGLHFDYNDNFLAQIYGTKKVLLVAPNDTKYLYPLPDNFSKTQVNPMKPDLVKFPKLKHATIFEGEIKTGDVLFIPKGWYHYIYSPKDSISLNCWFGSSLKFSEMAMFFYRSGPGVWIKFIHGFIWHGILNQPFKGKLYCSDTMGQRAYKYIIGRFNFSKE
jgi:hypothetical protein